MIIAWTLFLRRPNLFRHWADASCATDPYSQDYFKITFFFHFYHLFLKNLSVPLSYGTQKPVCQRSTLLSSVNDYCFYILGADWFCKSGCQLGCIWYSQKAVTLEKCAEVFPGRVFRERGWSLQRCHILQRLGYWDSWGKIWPGLACPSKLHVTSTLLLMWLLPFLSGTENQLLCLPAWTEDPWLSSRFSQAFNIRLRLLKTSATRTEHLPGFQMLCKIRCSTTWQILCKQISFIIYSFGLSVSL